MTNAPARYCYRPVSHLQLRRRRASPGAAHHLRSYSPDFFRSLVSMISVLTVITMRVTWTYFYTEHVNTYTPFNRYATALASACLRAYAYACARTGGDIHIAVELKHESKRERERERNWMELCNIASFAYDTCYRCENAWLDLYSLSFGICIATCISR